MADQDKQPPQLKYTYFAAGAPLVVTAMVFLAIHVSDWFAAFGVSALWMLIVISSRIEQNREQKTGRTRR
jgi:hypothetical protein